MAIENPPVDDQVHFVGRLHEVMICCHVVGPDSDFQCGNVRSCWRRFTAEQMQGCENSSWIQDVMGADAATVGSSPLQSVSRLDVPICVLDGWIRDNELCRFDEM